MNDDDFPFWQQPADKPALVHLSGVHIAAFAAVVALVAAAALEMDRRQRLREREEERRLQEQKEES